jgi:tetratricopeptide (TPR) repeat protein
MNLSSFLRVRAAAVLTIGASLGACANIAAGPSHSARNDVTAQPLQRVTVPADVQQRDLLTHLIAGELALGSNNLETATREYAAAAQLSNDPNVAEQAAHIAVSGKRWDSARTALARWQVLSPDDNGVRQVRAMLAMHDGDADAAYADLLRLAQQPDGAGWRAISQALLGGEDKAWAGAMAERLLRDDASNSDRNRDEPLRLDLLGPKPDIFVAVSQMAARLERKKLAQTLADQAATRFGTPETYAWAAQLKLGAGDKAGARKLFADALRKNPHDLKTPRLRIAYAAMLSDTGDNLAAANVMAEGPQTDFTYTARAGYLARGDDKTTKPQIDLLYSQVRALPPPRLPARLNLLGQLSELREQKAEALSWYAQIPRDDERWFGVQLRTAVLLSDTGKPSESASLLHELQARSGDDGKQLGETFMLEADLLQKRKHGEEAIAVYDRGLLALPDDTRLIYARALLNDDLNHVDAAVRDLRRVLELKPDDADAMNALGYTLADHTDKKTEALALIEKALKLKPGEPAIIDSLGWVQYRLGNMDAAVQQLRSAYDKQPDPEIAAHLGEVLWVSGQKDEARKVWDQGRAKDGDNKVLIETIKRLAS